MLSQNLYKVRNHEAVLADLAEQYGTEEDVKALKAAFRSVTKRIASPCS